MKLRQKTLYCDNSFNLIFVYVLIMILHVTIPDRNVILTQIGHIQYIKILTWLRGFQDKPLYLVLFLYPSLFWELGDKRSLKNLQFWPESLGIMFEYL